MNKFFTSILFYILIFGSVQARGESSPRFVIFAENNCHFKKNYQFLSKQEKQNFEDKLNQNLASVTIRKLNVNCANEKSNAYILNDKVRTKYQTLLVWTKKEQVAGIEVLEFYEPKQYQAPKAWYSKLKGLNLKKLHEIDALSGATLTRQSTIKLLKQALVFDTK